MTLTTYQDRDHQSLSSKVKIYYQNYILTLNILKSVRDREIIKL